MTAQEGQLIVVGALLLSIMLITSSLVDWLMEKRKAQVIANDAAEAKRLAKADPFGPSISAVTEPPTTSTFARDMGKFVRDAAKQRIGEAGPEWIYHSVAPVVSIENTPAWIMLMEEARELAGMQKQPTTPVGRFYIKLIGPIGNPEQWKVEATRYDANHSLGDERTTVLQASARSINEAVVLLTQLIRNQRRKDAQAADHAAIHTELERQAPARLRGCPHRVFHPNGCPPQPNNWLCPRCAMDRHEMMYPIGFIESCRVSGCSCQWRRHGYPPESGSAKDAAP